MASVIAWTPFGVALNLTAEADAITRTSATQFTVKFTAAWGVFYEGAYTNYGMSATSGGVTKVISAFGTKRSSGSATFTGTYSISGNGSATKTVTVTFKNYNDDNGNAATKAISLSVKVPAWTSYKVSYNANGGTGAPSSQTKWKNQTLKLSSTTPTRAGYSFQGWATSASGGVAYAAGANYTANAKATLYAVWEANTYTVSYNANGGTGEPGSQTKTHDTALELSGTIPTRTNYKFLGWATSASATVAQYAAGGSYTANADVTLYAVWQLSYVKPRISSLSVSRCNSSGVESDEGTYALVKFAYECDQGQIEATVSWESSNREISDSKAVPISNGKASAVVGDGTLSTDATFSFTITVKDALGSSDSYATLSGKAFAIDFLAGGNGVAFGKPAEQEGVAEFAFTIQDKFGAMIGNGLAAYTGGGDSGIDPNTTLEELCLTSHSNGPQGLGTFYYIHTAFYNAKSATASRMQVAIPYNKTGSIYHRYYASGAWSSWARYLTADEMYPVGSVCIRYDTTSPATLYGGTWQRIEGRMLFGCATSGTVGQTGTHTTGSGSSSLPYVNVAIWRRTA